MNDLLSLIRGNTDVPPLEVVEAKPKDEPPKKRVFTVTKIKQLREMIESFDHRLVGRTIRQFERQLDLDDDQILAIFAEYPNIMRHNPTTNLWGLNPAAESDPARKATT